MNPQIRVVHYLNQFFAQIGGEDKAEIGPQIKPGLIGPGRHCSKRWASTAKSSRRYFAVTIILPSTKRRRSTN